VASIFAICVYFGFISLYATLVCVAGSQLEKNCAALLEIRQTHAISLLDCGGETDEREEAGQKNTHSEQFLHIQEQLNSCVRHYQEIKR